MRYRARSAGQIDNGKRISSARSPATSDGSTHLTRRPRTRRRQAIGPVSGGPRAPGFDPGAELSRTLEALEKCTQSGARTKVQEVQHFGQITSPPRVRNARELFKIPFHHNEHARIPQPAACSFKESAFGVSRHIKVISARGLADAHARRWERGPRRRSPVPSRSKLPSHDLPMRISGTIGVRKVDLSI